MLNEPPVFDAAFRSRLRELLAWRRDVRRFRREPLRPGTVERLIDGACLAPSVGLSEPWRFVIVDDRRRRTAVTALFEACNAEALAGYAGAAADHYARLKLAGLDEAPVHLAVFADRATVQGRGLGRRTMPETADYSAVAAINLLWLLARAEGVGVGWVSILEPGQIATILDVPPEWRFVGYLCLGYPQAQDDVPALERDGWEHRHGVENILLHR